VKLLKSWAKLNQELFSISSKSIDDEL